MQYNRHNFKSKQKLTAQQMNEIEQGIVDLVDHANSSDGKLNLTIGTVTSGSTAAATFSNGKLNLVLPKGEKGEAGANGAAGAKGDTGATPNITIGTVTTGTDAAATITGTAESPMLNLVLPKGEKGDDLYFNVSSNGETYTFLVESYLCDKDSDVYKAVKELQIGDTIDAEGFLYWYEGVNPHITAITVK